MKVTKENRKRRISSFSRGHTVTKALFGLMKLQHDRYELNFVDSKRLLDAASNNKLDEGKQILTVVSTLHFYII